MTEMTEKNRLHDILRWEEEKRYSREVVTIEAGQELKVGTVVARLSGTGSIVQIDLDAEDGTQIPIGFVIDNYRAFDSDAEDAAPIDIQGVAIVRQAIFKYDGLVWPEIAPPGDVEVAIGILAEKGIITHNKPAV